MKRLTYLVVAMSLISGAASCASDGSNKDLTLQPSDPAPRRSVAILSPLEVYTAERALDWFTNAERIVVLRVVSESEVPATRDNVLKGFDLSGRKIVAEVERTLWSAPATSDAVLPHQIEMKTAGWLADEEGRRLAVAASLSSRLEVGHRYVVGLSQKSLDCDRDVPARQRWSRFASGAAIPYDSDVLGIGEFQGQIVDRPFGGAKLLTEGFQTVAGHSAEEMIPLMIEQSRQQEPRPTTALPTCEQLTARE